MTAVEYLEYMWTLQGAIYKNDIDKALEMEKEQIAKAIDDDFMHHIRRTTTMHELKYDDEAKHITKTFQDLIKDGDIIAFDDSKHEKKYDDLKERNGRFG